jgi:hypothetical protein
MGTRIRSFRILRKNWQLSAVAVFSLAIAMALGVICCSLADTSLLAPPAGVALDRLVTIYFISHVQADLARESREAGCDVVMARSAFSQQLPQIVSKYTASDAAPISQPRHNHA